MTLHWSQDCGNLLKGPVKSIDKLKIIFDYITYLDLVYYIVFKEFRSDYKQHIGIEKW